MQINYFSQGVRWLKIVKKKKWQEWSGGAGHLESVTTKLWALHAPWRLPTMAK